MSSLSNFFKQLLSDARAGRRRHIRHGDPAKGIEYNNINTSRGVSKYTLKVDIARSPQYIKNLRDPDVDVHNRADKANDYNSMVNYRAGKFKGRTVT